MTQPLDLAAMKQRMAKLPFNNHVGIRVARVHRDGVTVECPIRPEHGNMHGTLHGGVTATLVDVAGGFAALVRYGGMPVTTVEMKVSYFTPITGRKVRARSKILRAGKTLCVSQVEVSGDDGKLAAVAIITYMVLPPKQ